MAPVLCAMLVVFVRVQGCSLVSSVTADRFTDYAKLTRKAGGNKAAIGSSNLRPKSGGPESSGA